MKPVLTRLISRLSIFLFTATPALAQVELFYDVGVFELTDAQKKILVVHLDSLDQDLKYEIEIQGFADKLGSASSNLVLSKNRARAVTEFILSSYATLVDTTTFMGMGEIESTEEERSLYRKVRIDFVVREAVRSTEEKEIPLILPELKVGESYVVEGLNFKTGRAILLKESFPKIKQLFLWLKRNKSIEVEIQGHVCCSMNSKDPFVKTLSTGRAKVIHDILIKSGVDPKRLSYKGYGFSRPKYFPEKTEEDQKGNRRVEVKILKM